MKKTLSRVVSTLTAGALFIGMLSGVNCWAEDVSADVDGGNNAVEVTPQISDQGTKLTDMYLVLDNSRSMKETDPDKLLAKCAEKFFTLAPAGESTIGVITYSKEVDDIKEPVKCTANIDDLGNLGYDQSGKGTNIGNALATAGARLTSEGNNQNKGIVLVTDGDPDFTSTRYEPVVVNGQTIPVYCVFVNGGENDAQFACREYLDNIAKDTGVGNIFEVNTTEEIEDIITNIVGDMYGYIVKPESIAIDEMKDVTCDVGDNIYEVNAEIAFDANKPLTLKITDGDKNVLYDTGTNYDRFVTVSTSSKSHSVKIQWPNPGTYTFTLTSEEAQNIQFTLIEISAGLTLMLDNNGVVEQGKTIDTTCALVGNTNATVTGTKLRVYDDKKQYSLSSDKDDSRLTGGQDTSQYITANTNGGYTIDTKTLKTGEYGVVAISSLSDGTQVASVMETMTVTEPSKLAEKLMFVIPVLLLLAAVAVGVVLIRKKIDAKPRTCRPIAKSQLNVRVMKKENGSYYQLTLLERIPMAGSMPDGKHQSLASLLYNHMRKKNGALDGDPIPNELETIIVSCWKQNAQAKDEKQWLYIDTKSDGRSQKLYLDGNTSISLNDEVRVDLDWK